MNPQDQIPMSRPVPSNTMQSNVAPPPSHMPLPSQAPPPAPMRPAPSSSPGPKSGGKGLLIFLVIVLLGTSATLGYLYFKQRQKPISTTSSPVATPTNKAEDKTDTFDLSQTFSSNAAGKKNKLSTKLTVPAQYRSQVQLNPNTYYGVASKSYLKLMLSDGYSRMMPTGESIGNLEVIELSQWLDGDDVASAADATSPFGAAMKSADKKSQLANLQGLITAKDKTIANYLPTAKNKPLFPFATNAANSSWRNPDLLDLGNGWQGYATIGQQVQNTGWRPETFVVMLGKVKNVDGVDKQLMVFGRFKLADALTAELNAKDGEASSLATKIAEANAEVVKTGKYSDRLEAAHTELLD
ncbi:MAG: hypothetical protein WCI47_01450, partial [bacterium]